MTENGDLSNESKRWAETTYAKAKERGGEREDTDFSTSSADVGPLYTPEDVVQIDYNRDIGYPGEYPYTRGVQASMYRGRMWSIRQYAGYGTAAETNKRFRFLLKEGQPGLSVAFDLPTQLGYDSDDPLSMGEVGKVGVAIDTLADMETMFDGIPLDQVSTSMTINAPASVLVAMYAVVGQKQGVPLDRIAGTAQNDVLKEYVARGTYIYPPKPSLRLAADLMSYCARELPRFNAISISGYHMREAGCTAAQEMAFTFANAIAYIEGAIERGVSVDDVGPRISWIFNTQNNFLEEVAKYRALRRMWAKIMRERVKAEGGAIAAIESGYVQREIQEASYAYQQAIDEGKKVIVGVNKFANENEEPQMIFRVNPEAERAQIERLAHVRKERDQALVDAALSRLEEVSREGDAGRAGNLMHPIMEAVKAYASVGEICGVMRRVFGDYQPPTAV